MQALGVDAGGTKVLGAIVDEQGRIEHRLEVPTHQQRAEESISQVARHLQSLGEIKAMGVGAAGFVDLNGRVTFAPNLRYGTPDVGPWLSGELGLPVLIENDANCAAWGEWRFGSGRGSTNMIMLTLGTGVGGGIVVDRRLYRGSNGMAGELGHVSVEPNGPRCACGRQGCLEAMSSGDAIGRGAVELGDGGFQAGPDRVSTGKDVSRAATSGSAEARDILAKAGYYLGVALADFTNIFDPDVFVIGGGAAGAGEMILGPAREHLASQIRGGRQVPELVLASLGNDAGVIGAADLAREQGAADGNTDA